MLDRDTVVVHGEVEAMVRAGEHVQLRGYSGFPELGVQVKRWRGATAIKRTRRNEGGGRTTC